MKERRIQNNLTRLDDQERGLGKYKNEMENVVDYFIKTDTSSNKPSNGVREIYTKVSLLGTSEAQLN